MPDEVNAECSILISIQISNRDRWLFVETGCSPGLCYFALSALEYWMVSIVIQLVLVTGAFYGNSAGL